MAASLSTHSQNRLVLAWLESIVDPGTLLFCRATQQSYLRLLSTAAVLAPYGNPPLSNGQAWDAYHRLQTDDRIAFAEEPAGLEVLWEKLATRRTPSPKVWMDAYLAAFAIAGGHRLVTTDTAFRQFAGLDLLLLGAA